MMYVYGYFDMYVGSLLWENPRKKEQEVFSDSTTLFSFLAVKETLINQHKRWSGSVDCWFF